MPATKRGIYHNLKESEYTISNSDIVFFFSSQLYRQKFLSGYKNHRKIFEHILSKVAVENMLNMDMLADISFYKIIEKRGFRAWLKGIDISCEEIHRYALRKMIDKNTLDWFEIQKPKLDERLKIME